MYPTGACEQLFDLENVMHEQHYLVGEPSCQAMHAELWDRLMELIILQDYSHTPRELFKFGVD